MSEDRNRVIAETLEEPPDWGCPPTDASLWLATWGQEEWLPMAFDTDSAAHVALMRFVMSDQMPEGWRVTVIRFARGSCHLLGSGEGAAFIDRPETEAPDPLTAFRDSCYELCLAIREEAPALDDGERR